MRDEFLDLLNDDEYAPDEPEEEGPQYVELGDEFGDLTASKRRPRWMQPDNNDLLIQSAFDATGRKWFRRGEKSRWKAIVKKSPLYSRYTKDAVSHREFIKDTIDWVNKENRAYRRMKMKGGNKFSFAALLTMLENPLNHERWLNRYEKN